MKYRVLLAPSAILFLGACVESNNVNSGNGNGFIKELPEAVVQIAAPSQDLTAVVLLPEDGCYWYQYAGPVETTLLPLRTVEGRPICTRPQS